MINLSVGVGLVVVAASTIAWNATNALYELSGVFFCAVLVLILVECRFRAVAERGGWRIGVSLRWRCGISGSCRNEVTALVARGYCIGAGPMYRIENC